MRRELEPAPVVIVRSNDPYRLQAMLERERGRRAVLVRSPMVEVQPGLWQVQVIQLRSLERPWVRPAAVGVGIVGGLAGVAALSWWLVSMAVSVVAGVGVTALAGFAALVALTWLLGRRGGGGRGGGGQLDVHVRYRP